MDARTAHLTIRSGKFVWAGPYESRFLPKAAGFRWEPNQKFWWTPDSTKAVALRKYADDAAAKALDTLGRCLSASAALTTETDFPVPQGLSYLGYQKAGVEFALNAFASGKGCLIADEMGLGKTIQLIGIINAEPAIKRAIIVCPATLKGNWARELKKWLVRPLTVEIWDSKNQPKADIIVVNYDILAKLGEKLMAFGADLIGFDESHYLKNPKAKRTKSGVAVGRLVKRKVCLTGTPILNRPEELWTSLELLDPHSWTSWWNYANRYCAAYRDAWGWHTDGASNLDELQLKLRSSCMVRRLKKDVLTELPPKRRSLVVIEPSAKVKAVIKRQQDAFRAMVDAVGHEEAVKKLESGGGFDFETISKDRAELADAKAEHVVAHVVELLEGGLEKVVVFAHHHTLLDALRKGLGEYGVVGIDGRTHMAERQGQVDQFQDNPGTRVFVGGIQAAGVGITLTASSWVVMAEQPWRPSDVSQAEDRCHRIGARDTVNVQHIVWDGSLDADMAQLIISKQFIADQALDTDPLAKADAKIEAAQAQADSEAAERAAKIEAAAKLSAAESVDRMTLEELQAVHAALRILAGSCDGAREKDDVGFNAMDARFGRDLAMQERISWGQARAARNMLRKYKRQIPQDLYETIFKRTAA